MQTFLPIASSDFLLSAEVLDRRRLHKQALEAWQILMVLLEVDPNGGPREPRGWRNHPAVLMWSEHERALAGYALAMCARWQELGYKTTLPQKIENTLCAAIGLGRTIGTTLPGWMLDDSFEKLASTHRRALLVKDFGWYQQFDWVEGKNGCPNGYEYFWPRTKETRK